MDARGVARLVTRAITDTGVDTIVLWSGELATSFTTDPDGLEQGGKPWDAFEDWLAMAVGRAQAPPRPEGEEEE